MTNKGNQQPLRVLSLFSGIGGFDLACEWAGMEIVGQVEIDPFCQRVLEKHWPDVPRYGDIHDVRGDEFGPVDVVVGGFPCQPFSIAGQRRGNADDRALWPQMRRIIAACQPAWVIAENVPGFINMALDDLFVDLDHLGYETGALVIPAAGVGAPHLRYRLWVVAYADRPRLEGQRREHRLRATAEAVGPGRGAGWPDFAGLRRVDDGISARLDPYRKERLTALGNAIVPQVAYEILRHLPGLTKGEHHE